MKRVIALEIGSKETPDDRSAICLDKCSVLGADFWLFREHTATLHRGHYPLCRLKVKKQAVLWAFLRSVVRGYEGCYASL